MGVLAKRGRWAAKTLVVLLVANVVLSQPSPAPPSSGGGGSTSNASGSAGGASASGGSNVSDPSEALVNYTNALLEQNLSVLGQAVRVPYSVFSSHACQVLYLASQDWASAELAVEFVPGTLSLEVSSGTCDPSRQQAFFAYVDGHHVPKGLGGVTLSSSDATWAALVTAGGSNNGEATGPTSIPLPSSSGRRLQNFPGSAGGAGLQQGPTGHRLPGEGFRKQELRQLLDARDAAAGLGLQTDSAAYQSAFDNLRSQVRAVQELLLRGRTVAPGPDGPLARPVLASSRKAASVATPSGYSKGALQRLAEQQKGQDAGALLAAHNNALVGRSRVYKAPLEDCLRLMRLQGAGSSSQAATAQSSRVRTASRVDSCFVAQHVMYIYNGCVSNVTSNNNSASALSVGGDTTSDTQDEVVQVLQASLSAASGNTSWNENEGYVLVSVKYKPYNRCLRSGMDTLTDLSTQVLLFAALTFGSLLLFLLLPSLYRLFLEFPAKLLMHGIRKLMGRTYDLKPLKPGLHSQKSKRSRRLDGWAATVFGPVLRLRKYLLYAVATVHSSDGQSRSLQVSIISTVALSISMAVYTPHLEAPLEYFVPPLALQITRRKSAVAALMYFLDIIWFSSFMGTLGYLSMLANYNSSVNMYYRVQCSISGFFMVLLDLLVLLQLISLLGEWKHLVPAWPYLPMVFFQIVNLVAANILQVIIFTKRHDQHDRQLYQAYVRTKQDRTDAEAAVRRRAVKALKASAAAASANAANTSSDGEGGFVDSAGAARGNDGGSPRDGFVDFRRHRERVSRPHPSWGAGARVRSGRTGATPAAPETAAKSASHPPNPQSGFARSGSGRVGRRQQDSVLSASKTQGENTGGSDDAAESLAARPRRRLLMDGDAGLAKGPGPVAEGREDSSDSDAMSFLSEGAGSASDTALLSRRDARSGTTAADSRGGRPRRARLLDATGDSAYGPLGAEHGDGGGMDPAQRRHPYGTGGLGGSARGDRRGLPSAAGASAPGPGDGAGDGRYRRLHEEGEAPIDRDTAGVRLAQPEKPLARQNTVASSRDVSAKPSYSRKDGSRAPDNSVGRSSRTSGPKDTSAARGTAKLVTKLRALWREDDSGDEQRTRGDDSSEDEGPGGLMGLVMWPATATLGVVRELRESRNFRYPAWLLAALLVSGYMVIFQYGRALEWSNVLGDCIKEPSQCVGDTLGRYVRFASRLLGRDQQLALRDSLEGLMDTRGRVQQLLDSALNATAAAAAASINTTADTFITSPGNSANLTEEVSAAITGYNLTHRVTDHIASIDFSALVVSALSGLNGTTNTTDGATGADNVTATVLAAMGPGLASALQAQLASAVTSRLRDLPTSDNLTRTIVAAISEPAAASPPPPLLSASTVDSLRVRASSLLSATLDELYDSINVTSSFMGRALQLQDEVRSWQDGLHDSFVWSSVFGFTMGLILGLSTLVQTAISFRRAVRRAHKMRIKQHVLMATSSTTQGRHDMDKAGLGGGGGESQLLVHRSMRTSISLVVFFFGVLMSTAVIQLYMVGVLLSVLLAIVTHPWTWNYFMPTYWLYLAAICAVVVLNKFVLIGYVGDAFLSNGDHIYRPAAWLAFTFIMSITNLAIGLLLAVYRIVLLLLTTVLSLGKLEVTIFALLSILDLPHNSFLAGLHMHESMSSFHDPIYLPGPRGRAHRRWRKLRATVRRLSPEELRLLATLGRPKEVQDMLDHVVIDMQAAKALAAGGRPSLAADSRPSLAANSRALAAGSRPLAALSRQAGAAAPSSNAMHASGAAAGRTAAVGRLGLRAGAAAASVAAEGPAEGSGRSSGEHLRERGAGANAAGRQGGDGPEEGRGAGVGKAAGRLSGAGAARHAGRGAVREDPAAAGAAAMAISAGPPPLARGASGRRADGRSVPGGGNAGLGAAREAAAQPVGRGLRRAQAEEQPRAYGSGDGTYGREVRPRRAEVELSGRRHGEDASSPASDVDAPEDHAARSRDKRGEGRGAAGGGRRARGMGAGDAAGGGAAADAAEGRAHVQQSAAGSRGAGAGRPASKAPAAGRRWRLYAQEEESEIEEG